ncbi:MAG: hypothetical protein R3B81_17025 [bacterium]
MKATPWAVPAALVLMLTLPAAARDHRGDVSDVTAIVHESGAGRVLFHADLNLPEVPVGLAVRRATLQIPVANLELSRALTVRVHPVSTAWSPGSVSWDEGWQRPGGDFDDRLHARAELGRGHIGELSFDVTMLVKEIVAGNLENRGFLLTVDPREGLGLPPEDLPGFVAVGAAHVDVQYRETPVRPARFGGE